jgi:manganese/zinc/iron transport system permease protein
MLSYFTNINLWYVLLSTSFLSMGLAWIGTFTVLRKQALSGDVVSHGVLPGIAMAFLLIHEKNYLILLLGASFTGAIALYTMDFLKRNSKLKEDTTMAIVLSVFFGAGIWLLTIINGQENATQAGLEKFLFGKAASLLFSDFMFICCITIIIGITILIFYKAFFWLSFDKNYVQTLGFPIRTIQFLLTTLTVLAIIAGIQAVGVVLVSALLITPSISARFWTNKLSITLLLSTIFSLVSTWIGVSISYHYTNAPTAPWIVVISFGLAIGSFLFAPHKGWWVKYQKFKRNQKKIVEENLLKCLYHLFENTQKAEFSRENILQKRVFQFDDLEIAIRKNIKKEFLKEKVDNINNIKKYEFTEKGIIEGKRITRLHRLWELYLNQYLRIAPDHVHEDAETIEHFITPEVEKKILEQLNYPTKDPHGKKI